MEIRILPMDESHLDDLARAGISSVPPGQNSLPPSLFHLCFQVQDPNKFTFSPGR